jgi:Mg2+-importing ATPase
MRPHSRPPSGDSAPPPTPAWWSEPADQLLARLGSGPGGLAAAAARTRLKHDGPNALADEDETAALRLLLRQFANPLVLILVFGGIVSLFLHEMADALIILVVVVGSALLGFTQEHRASRAVARLRRRLALKAEAVRGGVVTPVDARDLVRGDVIRLAAGDLVPADARVLEARDFLVTEAALTGESFPVEKEPGILAPDAPLARRTNAIHLGSSVRSGTATAVVVETGRATAFGRIAARVAVADTETEFERGLRRFGYLLLRIMVLMILFVLVVNQLLGRPAIESLLFAVALAVGLSPELLPAIVSVTLAHGARAMAARGVIVRRLDAIENFGSIDVLCTDKTGTLTEGAVALDAAFDADGRPSSGVLRLGYLNAAFETGIANPLDAAIIAAGERAGLSTAGIDKIDEIPYDFLRRRLTVVVREAGGSGASRMIAKGAFANVLEACGRMRAADGGTVALDDAARRQVTDAFVAHGAAGFRVLAVASRDVEGRARFERTDETGMVLEGLLRFRDPPKEGVGPVIANLAALGIRIKIVTGDNRHVAAHVAREIGLDPDAILTGEAIARMRDEALTHRAARTDLFVEVDPQQKERIVLALRKAGHVVGYLGDGINDAPPLKAADVGISVDSAVDVARETADVVLLRPDLDVLRQGVLEGRRTFANTLKYVSITTSANFGNMISMAIATPFLPFLPLAAKQILLNNFLSDLPSIAISTDRVDDAEVREAQRWHVGGVRRFMLVFGLVSTAFDLLTFALLLAIVRADEATFQTTWFVVSLATELAVVLVLRTRHAAWRSVPSLLLLVTTLVVGAATFALPYVPALASLFAFVPLPPPLLATALAIVLAYIVTTEIVKAWFFGPGRTMAKTGAR